MNNGLKKIILLVMVLIFIPLVGFNINRGDAYLQINEEYIGKDEVAFIEKSIKSSLISEIQGKYGIPYDQNFWDVEIEGVTAGELLENKVIEILVRNTVIEGLLEDENILQYDSFEAFNELLTKVNRERNEAVANKEVIYGPVEYSQLDYYNYLMANNLIVLRNTYIQSNKIEMTNDILHEYEKANPELVHEEPSTLETELIYMKFIEEDGTLNQEKEKLYFTYMNEVYELLKQGTKLQDIVEKYPNSLKCEEYVFDAAGEKSDLNRLGNLLYELRKIDEGEFTSVTYDNGAYYIGVLNKKEESYKRPFEEYKDFLTIKYADQWLEDYIEKLVEVAEVKKLKQLKSVYKN